jgi:hypothetical protein
MTRPLQPRGQTARLRSCRQSTQRSLVEPADSGAAYARGAGSVRPETSANQQDVIYVREHTKGDYCDDRHSVELGVAGLRVGAVATYGATHIQCRPRSLYSRWYRRALHQDSRRRACRLRAPGRHQTRSTRGVCRAMRQLQRRSGGAHGADTTPDSAASNTYPVAQRSVEISFKIALVHATLRGVTLAVRYSRGTRP